MNSGFGIMIWGEDEVVQLINRYYPEYACIWKKIKNFGKKADFARLLIMHKYGGYYVDPDQEPLKPLEQFICADKIYCKGIRGHQNLQDRVTEEPIDMSMYDIIIGSDNFSARRDHRGSILTNCFFASIPNNNFWIEFVKDRIPHYDNTVLTSFGPWALTDYMRENPQDRFLELPSYYFNWIPDHMKCDPYPFTYSLHHSKKKWIERRMKWHNQK